MTGEEHMSVNIDYRIKCIKEDTLFVLLISIQLAAFGILALDAIGVQVPFIRQLIGILYFIFIPGALIISILHIKNAKFTHLLLYSIGLSLSFSMALGFTSNLLLPIVGVINPLSRNVMYTLYFIATALLSVAYICNKQGLNCTKDKLYPSLPVHLYLFIIVTPVLSIVGTYCVNVHHMNTVLIAMFIAIGIILSIVTFTHLIPGSFYPYILWSIGISLIWHKTLISDYLIVNDVVGEYFVADLILKNQLWDWTIQEGYNGVLSTVVLAPALSHFCGLDLTWVFKAIFPFIYSFLVIGVYELFVSIFKGEKLAFFSTFLLISVTSFSGSVALITKQSTAELFFVIFLLVLMTMWVSDLKRSLLMIIFGISIIVSHYATSYLVMLSLLFTFMYLCAYNLSARVFKIKCDREGLLTSQRASNPTNLTPHFILLFIFVSVAWYMYIAQSSTFNQVIEMIRFAASTLSFELFQSDSSRTVYLLSQSSKSILSLISTILYILVQFGIGVGLIKVILERKKICRINNLFLGLALFFLFLLAIGYAHTSLSALSPTRLLHITLIVLAPFSIIGLLYLFDLISKLIGYVFSVKFDKLPVMLLMSFLLLFLYVNLGLVHEFTQDHPTSISLSQETILNSDDIYLKSTLFGAIIPQQNVFSGKWIGRFGLSNYNIYRGDWVEGYPSLTIYGGVPESLKVITNANGDIVKSFDNATAHIGEGYIQLTVANVKANVGSSWYNPLQKRTPFMFSDVNMLLIDASKVYDNGDSKILLNY
ncbi:MAG: hypothetical protein BWY74_03589 [Firmicutes bacterium ADurb.Bin419]|nr:MAG: hypothetical protein BWY74_03589 [Firmicutes bacterium ADurb.Bin419]